jgi:hypothetical protein
VARVAGEMMDGPTNSNCLEGMRCPKCKSDGPFSIVSSCVAEWTDDGTEDIHDVEFDDDSNCRCVSCMHSATVDDFRVKKPTGALPVRLAKKGEVNARSSRTARQNGAARVHARAGSAAASVPELLR